MSPIPGTQCASPNHSSATSGHIGQEAPTDREGPQQMVSPQGRSFFGVSGGNPGQTRSHANAPQDRDTVSHGPMNCSGTPGMSDPLAEGARTVPVYLPITAIRVESGLLKGTPGLDRAARVVCFCRPQLVVFQWEVTHTKSGASRRECCAVPWSQC